MFFGVFLPKNPPDSTQKQLFSGKTVIFPKKGNRFLGHFAKTACPMVFGSEKYHFYFKPYSTGPRKWPKCAKFCTEKTPKSLQIGLWDFVILGVWLTNSSKLAIFRDQFFSTTFPIWSENQVKTGIKRVRVGVKSWSIFLIGFWRVLAKTCFVLE